MADGKTFWRESPSGAQLWPGVLIYGYGQIGMGIFLYFYLPNKPTSSPMKKSHLLLTLALALPLWGWSQNSRIKFDHISLEQGLSQSNVYSIEQDYRGFMWFATLDGLNRYDGYEVLAYRNNPDDPNTISDNAITVVYEDASRRLWVGTRGAGLCLYDRYNDVFVRFQHDPADPGSLCGNEIRTIAEDGRGGVWFGTDSGLCLLDTLAPSGRIRFSTFVSGVGGRLTQINDMAAQGMTKLWVATDSAINAIDIVQGGIVSYRTSKETDSLGIRSNTINTLLIDGDTLWLGTDYGLRKFRLGISGMSKVKFYTRENSRLSNDAINAIEKDANGILWLGTAGGGLVRFDPSAETFAAYRNDPTDPNSLSVDNVNCLFQDRAGLLWVGTSLGGVNKWSRAAEDLDLFRHNPYDPNSLSSNQVRSIYMDRQGQMWVGTVETGLNRWDRSTNQFWRYRFDPTKPNTLPNNHVRAMFEDSRGNFWVATDGGGLALMDRQKGTFKVFKHDENLPGSLTNNRVWDVQEDSNGNLWVATFGGGLCLYDYNSQTFKAFRQGQGQFDLANDFVTTLFEDSKKRFWVGTYGGGLQMFKNPPSDGPRFYRYPTNGQPGAMGDDRVYSVFEDSRGWIWVGTKGSLNRFNEHNNTFESFDEKDGLPNDVIMGVLEDRAGRLWVSTNRGLGRFEVHYDTLRATEVVVDTLRNIPLGRGRFLNPTSIEVRNYDVRDGLQSNEFLVGSYFMTAQGEMLFGGINGFNAFFPDKMRDNEHAPEVVITGFSVLNRVYNELDTVISEKTHIVLNHDQDVISIDFVALDYVFPSKNQYKYRMVNLDQDWNNVGTRRFATYNQVPPGEYIFEVLGSNNDGKWSKEPIRLYITIEPAWWQTTLAKVGAVLAILLSLYFWYLVRTAKMRRQKERLEEEVRLRTAEVVQQKEEIEAQRDAIEEQRDEIEAQRDAVEKQRMIAENQRDQIEHQRQEILDSIHYARRIQRATLSDHFPDNIISESFVLFKPKDIVSGDFYWFTAKENRKLIVLAADCTGHGVPGAFMSMLGVSFLNRIVNETDVENPTQILGRLRDSIIKSLNQKGIENEARDGMDGSLCTVDMEAMKLYFAGANNPMILIRDGELEIVKPDKMPIAIYDRMDPFTTHEFDIKTGDVFYIFSDGYQDQFGGSRGKKFKIKRFRDVILENHHLPMAVQGKILDDIFEEWRGEQEQVDDILVIGIRI